MAGRFCTSCGGPLAPDERFCGGCGHPATPTVQPAGPASPPPPPVAPTPPPVAPAPPLTPPSTGGGPVRSGRAMWWVVGVLAVAIVAVVAAGLAIGLAGDDPVAAPGVATPPVTALGTAPPSTAATTTTGAASQRSTTTTRPTPTSRPTTAPSTSPPAPADGFFVPEEALSDWAWRQGLNYQGECASLDSMADYGADPWCAVLWEDRGGQLVYRVADFPGGDAGAWVLVVTGETGWVVADWADDVTGTPPF